MTSQLWQESDDIEKCHEWERRLAKVAASVETKNCHWIETPDGDHGDEWCTDCGKDKVRDLRKHDPRHRSDYILDGGWRSEYDSPCFCAKCGAILDVSLTKHGALSELEHYLAYPPTPGDPRDAHFLAEMLAGLPDDAVANGIKVVRAFFEDGRLS